MASSSKVTVEDDIDIDAFLNAEASILTREKEMHRILASFKLNPYEVLDIPLSSVYADPDSIATLVKKTYRTKSLLIHPDKLKHEDGPKAFDLLKKAEAELSNPDKKKNLDEIIQDARMLILRELDPPLRRDTPDSHPTLKRLNPSLAQRVRDKAKQLLIDEELRRRRVNKLTMIAEGAESQRKEVEQQTKKRAREEVKAWEDSRETRVKDWRNFKSGGTRKKPKVYKALG